MSLEDPTIFSDVRSDSPTPPQPPKVLSAKSQRRQLGKLRRKYETTLQKYYSMGTSYSEPIASMMYSVASELGREDNDMLWMTIVGVSSMELYGRSSVGVAISTQKSSVSGWMGSRGSRVRQLLRDEVRRLNPPELTDHNPNGIRLPEASGLIQTSARSPNDYSIKLSPEPRVLLIRHWSLYESMLHSPYLAARMQIWSENGRRRLNKFLAKMGISLTQSKQKYAHMDMDLKQNLRNRLLKYADLYKMDDLVPATNTDGKDLGGSKEGWGFVKSWGWKATLSAHDVGVVIGAMLEVGKQPAASLEHGAWDRSRDRKEISDEDGTLEGEEWVRRFFDAYDALEK